MSWEKKIKGKNNAFTIVPEWFSDSVKKGESEESIKNKVREHCEEAVAADEKLSKLPFSEEWAVIMYEIFMEQVGNEQT